MFVINVGDINEIQFVSRTPKCSDTMLCVDIKPTLFSNKILEYTVYLMTQNIRGTLFIDQSSLQSNLLNHLSLSLVDDNGRVLGYVYLGQLDEISI